MTDNELRGYKKITTGIAAEYLGTSDDTVQNGILAGVFPFGVAFKMPGNKRWTYDIRTEALIYYKHYGKLPVMQRTEEDLQ